MEDKRTEISALLDFYGGVLSPRQKDVLDLYYNDDLSLSEIASELGITRQGVRDAILHGEESLFSLETTLGACARDKAVRAAASAILDRTTDTTVASLARTILEG